MASAATLFTQENLNYIEKFMRVRTEDLMMEVMDGIELFIDQEREIYGTRFDEQRGAIKTLVKMNGDIIEMPSTGIPAGGTDWEEGDSYEEKIVLTEYYGRAFVKESNLTKLNYKLSLLNLQTQEGLDSADRVMIEEGYLDLLKNNMYRGLMNKKKSLVLALLDGLKTKQINGVDYVVANSGTLLGGDNLAVQSFDETIQDTIISLNRGMKTLKGYNVAYSSPKYLFTEERNYTEALRAFNPAQSVNVNQRALFDYFKNGNSVFVDGIAFGTNKTIAIGAAHGFHILEETAVPRFVMATDSAGNSYFYLKTVFGVGINTRANVVEIDHT